jgi:hypothetical protein
LSSNRYKKIWNKKEKQKIWAGKEKKCTGLKEIYSKEIYETKIDKKTGLRLTLNRKLG